jgi:hypothetical protein
MGKSEQRKKGIVSRPLDAAGVFEDKHAIFPGGRAKFKATPQRLPELEGVGANELSPASVSDQLLQRVPGGSKSFISRQQSNYERDLASGVAPKDLIDFKKREELVKVVPEHLGEKNPAAFYNAGVVTGFDTSKLEKQPYGEWEPAYRPPDDLAPYYGEKEKEGLQESAKYNGYPVSDFGVDGMNKRGMAVLGHELTHMYTGGAERGNVERESLNAGSSYITDRGREYSQAATSGLNAMRDLTGMEFNTPEETMKLFDEVERNPKILDELPAEHGRLFRTYNTLKKSNPKEAEKLRNDVARDSQYLAGNGKKPPSIEEETMSMVRSYFSGRDNPSIV